MMAVRIQVGEQHRLRNGEDEDCDKCECRAVVRLTEATPNGATYGFYCKDCLEDVIEKQKQTS